MNYKICEPVTAIPCWAIYADYNGNAPDTKDLIFCAQEALALIVVDLLGQIGSDDDADTLEWDGKIWEGFSLPNVDGYHGSLSYRIRQVFLESDHKIATDIVSALEAFEAYPRE